MRQHPIRPNQGTVLRESARGWSYYTTIFAIPSGVDRWIFAIYLVDCCHLLRAQHTQRNLLARPLKVTPSIDAVCHISVVLRRTSHPHGLAHRTTRHELPRSPVWSRVYILPRASDRPDGLSALGNHDIVEGRLSLSLPLTPPAFSFVGPHLWLVALLRIRPSRDVCAALFIPRKSPLTGACTNTN